MSKVKGISNSYIHSKSSAWWEGMSCISNQESMGNTCLIKRNQWLGNCGFHSPGIDIDEVNFEIEVRIFAKDWISYHAHVLFLPLCHVNFLRFLKHPGNLKHKLSLFNVMTDENWNDAFIVYEIKHSCVVVQQHVLTQLRRLEVQVEEVLYI